jgi:hypothetical protein
MTRLQDIETAVSSLQPDELAKFREWFEAFEARRFDDRIRDAASGRLDSLAEEAIRDHREGRTRPL